MLAPLTTDQDLEDRVAAFEAAWFAGQVPNLATFLPDDEPQRLRVLCELMIVDRELRQRANLPALDYALLFPHAACSPAFQAALAHNEPKTQRLGRYEVGPLLGQGSFGNVYRGWDTQLRRPVAIKIPRAGALLTATEEERFVREARCAAGLQHPNIVALYDLGQHDQTLYLVYELSTGTTLATLLQAQRLGLREAAELVAVLARAVHYAHTQGIIHRDLKPANVLLTAGKLSSAKITDFGLAKRLDPSATLTTTGHIVGTPAYMAPEQGRGEASNATTDVYALGVLLYELLTGEVPFRGEPLMVLRQMQEDEPTPPKRLRFDVPHDLNTICLKCLHKEPSGRYATAQALADDLARWLQHQPILARPVGLAGRWRRWVQREPRLAALAAALVLVLAVGFTSTLLLYLHTKKQAAEVEGKRHEADAHFREALAVVDEYLTTIAETKLLDRPGLQSLRKELVTAALIRYRQFLEQRAHDPAIRAEVGRGWYRVGHLTYIVGPERDAVPLLEQALAIQEELVATQPHDREYQADRAATQYFLGYLTTRFGQSDIAQQHLHAAERTQRHLHKQEANATTALELAETLRALGRVQTDYGNPRDGERWLAEADAVLAPVEQQAEVARLRTVMRFELMQAKRARGFMREAFADLQRAEQVFALASVTPVSRSRRTLLVNISTFERDRWEGNIANGFGLLHIGFGQPADAVPHFQHAIRVRRQLAIANPDVTAYQAELASALMNHSIAVELTQSPVAAIPERLQAADMYRVLSTKNPELAHLLDTLAYVHRSGVQLLERQGQIPDAVATLNALLETLDRLPASRDVRVHRVETLAKRVTLWQQQAHPNILREQERTTAALIDMREELARVLLEQRRGVQANPTSGTYRRNLSVTLEQAATVERLLGSYPVASLLAVERLALWGDNPREQVRAACTWAVNLLHAKQSATPAWTALERALKEGFNDLGWMRQEQDRFPLLDQPEWRALIRSLEARR